MPDHVNPPAELVSFLEALSEPHILCDRDYRILAANEAYRAKWLGPAGATLIGRPCYEVSHHYQVPCDQAGESCPLQRSLHSGQRERVVHLHHTQLGERLESIERVDFAVDRQAFTRKRIGKLARWALR